MIKLIHAEFIKNRRSFSRKALILFPVILTLLAVFLMGGQLTQIGAYNWWYMLLLPVCLVLLCNNSIDNDKKTAYFNLYSLPISSSSVWLAKVLTVLFCLCIANFFLFGLTTITGWVFGSQFPVWRGLAAGLILSATLAWQIPTALFLTARFHSSIALIAILSVDFFCSGQPIAGGKAWLIPSAIPARLMTPLIRVNPNGVPLEMNSPLNNSNVILPGLLITLFLFGVLSVITCKWFERRGK